MPEEMPYFGIGVGKDLVGQRATLSVEKKHDCNHQANNGKQEKENIND